MARSRNVSSKTVVRDRPPSLASYIAESASRSRVSLVSLSVAWATPTLAVRNSSYPLTAMGRSNTAWIRAASTSVSMRFGAGVQEDELVATETGDELVGERGGQSFGGRPEHLVTSLMPDPVVDDLEPIEVDEQDDDRIAVQFATSSEARRAG